MDRNGKRLLVACLLGAAAMTMAMAPSPASARPRAADADYIVVLSDTSGAGVTARARSVADRFGGAVEHTYTAALRGFALRLDQDEARELAGQPDVAAVVPDTPVHALGEQVDPPSWGLDRIDQRAGLDNRYAYPNEARDVTAYVLDTGTSPHQDLAGRVLPGVDLVDGDADPADGNGHGTFVSGIIGGTSYGVAKKIRIVPVRVLDDTGSGSTADVIAGVDWVTAHAARPAVANLSLGGSPNEALDDAVRASIASGVSYTVAAGGSGTDAGDFSPARVVEALTVGASDMSDCVPANSNQGAVVDLFAPGTDITGPWPDGGAQTMSGSSLSAPHVAGAVGMYLQDHPAASAAEVSDAVVAASTKDALCGVRPGTANRLLYVGP